MAKKDKNSSRERKRKTNPVNWVIIVVGILLMWGLRMLLPHRLMVLLCMVGFLAGIVIFVVTLRPGWKGKNTSQLSFWGISFGVMGSLISFMGFVFTVNAYSFYKEPFISFWEISLILGLALGILFTVKFVWKNSGVGGRIGSIALGTLLSFFLIWVSLCHLNYLLDFHPPAEIHAVIEEKEISRHSKGPDSYEFEMTVDGETFELEVGFFEYLQYEVGDTYTFKEYQGAFRKPFYARD